MSKYQLQKKICEHCGKEFLPLKGSKGRFCSQYCWRLYQGKKLYRQYSSKEIELLKQYGPIETLQELATRLKGRSIKSIDNKLRELGIKLHATCPVCHREIEGKNRNTIYCSRRCFDKANNSRPERKQKMREAQHKPFIPKVFKDWDEEKIRKFFEKYKRSYESVERFAKRHGFSAYAVSRLFRSLYPDEWNEVIEIKTADANKLYARGRHFEYRVRDYLRGQGYFVMRSPQSHSVVDLVAIKLNEILFVQCKIGGKIGSKERDELILLANSVGAKAILAKRGIKGKHCPIILETLN